MYKNALIFVVGAAIGSLITYFAVKDSIEARANEEIESVKQVYSKLAASKNAVKENEKRKEEIGWVIFGRQLAEDFKRGYMPDEKLDRIAAEVLAERSDEIIEEEEYHPPEEIVDVRPYTISPDMFVNDKKYFDKITLEYYEGNDMLVEEITEEPVSIEDAIGRESLRMFGEFERDLVYVRNERLQTDYEVYHYSTSFSPKR